MSEFSFRRDIKSFSLQVFSGRWFMVFASFLIMSVNGATYIYSLYSGDIKSTLVYDQTTLNTLSFYKDLGFNIGSASAGFIIEVIPPWAVIAIGAVMNFSAYVLIWATVTGLLTKPHVWQMCTYMFLASNAEAYPNTGVLGASVRNFPESRGSVIGILKGFVGLSGAILTQFYHAIYGDDSKSLILLIAWLPTFVHLALQRRISVKKAVRQVQELKVFDNFLYVALCLAGFIMINIIIQNKFRFTRPEYIASSIIIFLSLFFLLGIVIKEEFLLWKNKKQALNNLPRLDVTAENPSSEVKLEPVSSNNKKIFSFKNILKRPKTGEDHSILQAIFSFDMLILFTSTSCSFGGASAAIDNLGQIADSLGYKTHTIPTLVSLVSIWNFLGRVLAGFASEIVLTKYKFPRPLMLAFVILLTCIGHILIAFGGPNSLYFSSIIIGFCFGAQMPLLIATISEIFGLKHISPLCSFGLLSSPVGSYIFNVKLAGHLYDKEALRQLDALGLKREDGSELNCKGVHCFRMAFLIITMTTLFGFLVSIILVYRTRKFYRGDIYKKFKEGIIPLEETEVEHAMSISASSIPTTVTLNHQKLQNMKQ